MFALELTEWAQNTSITIINDDYNIRYYILLLLVDCAWGDFSEWTQCSAECGTGTQTRTKTVKTEAEQGGAACDGDATETRDCNTHGCPGTQKMFKA